MPHIAAHFAGALREATSSPSDRLLRLQPHSRQSGDLMHMGVSEEWAAEHLDDDVKICHIYCRTISEFTAVERLILAITKLRPEIDICLFENIQSVNSYSLKDLTETFLAQGCKAIIFGEPEIHGTQASKALMSHSSLKDIPGVASKET